MVVGNVFLHLRHDLRCEPPYHLADAGLKFVVNVDARITANRRTNIVECRRGGSLPRGAVCSVSSYRSEHDEK